MKQPPIPTAPEEGRVHRAFATAWAFVQSLEGSNRDDAVDRIARLEREVEQLKESLRRSRQSGPVNADDAGPTSIEP